MFLGFARLCSASQHDHKPVHWVLPPTFPANRLGGVFRLKWITRRELPFTSAAHMHNPFNEDKPIKVGRDGTEIQVQNVNYYFLISEKISQQS